MDSGITLDRATFKALAADTLISILKALSRRRMTGAELAQATGLSPSTIKEHLDQLESAGLLQQVDEGRKWKYFQLTHKGRTVVSASAPHSRVWIVLGMAVLALAYSTWNIMNIGSAPPATSVLPGPRLPLVQGAPSPLATVIPTVAANADAGRFPPLVAAPASSAAVLPGSKVQASAPAAEEVPPSPPEYYEVPSQRQIGFVDVAIEVSLIIIVAGLAVYASKTRR